MSEVVVIVPTAGEACRFEDVASVAGGERVVVGGVGPVEMAVTVARLLREGALTLVLAGIAGACEGSELSVGQSVLVGAERTADMGAFRDGKFFPLFEREYLCPHIVDCGLPVVASNSVNAAGAPYVGDEASGFAFRRAADIENMEGAAFFALCLEAGARFVELRTVSNMVGSPRGKWRVDEAALALARDLKLLLNAIKA